MKGESDRLARRLSVEAMRGRVLAAIAAGTALAGGCTSRSLGGDGPADGDSASEGASTTADSGQAETADDSSSPSATAATTTGSNSTTTDPSAGGSTTDEVRFDLGAPPDTPDTNRPMPQPAAECVDSPPAGSTCDVRVSPPELLVYRCMDVLPADCDTLTSAEILDEAWACEPSCAGGFIEVACGPDPGQQEACCHWLVWTEGQFCPGRPFVVDDVARLPSTRARDDWGRAPEVDSVSEALRDDLAAAWLEHARFEHASIASFSRFVLQLLAVGAPARLVEMAQRALGEELEHARCFYGLASAYAGTPLGPGPLSVQGSLEELDLERITLAVVREGCVAETVSALQIAVAAQRARDPVVASALQRIAVEELRHAELAWSFLGWALRRGGEALRTKVADAFRNAPAFIPTGPEIADDPALLEHGLVPRSIGLQLAAQALDLVVAPAAATLLAPPAGRAERRPRHSSDVADDDGTSVDV